MSGDEYNGWTENRKLVLTDLERLNDTQGEILKTLAAIQTDMAGLKVHVGFVGGFFGVIGGLLAAIAVVVMDLIRK